MSLHAIRILMDNRAEDATLASEHGWSAWLDLGPDGAWLWDTGQTGLFLENAAAMGIDPLAATGVALSHGHHDHAGGLPALLERGFAGPVVGHPGLLTLRYSRRGPSSFRSIGMGDGRLKGCPFDFAPAPDVRELAPGLAFVAGIDRRPGAFTATANLFCDTAGLVPDTVPDDACLVADTARGPLVLLGCCHAGLGNTLSHVRRRLGLASVDTVVGGLHLAGAPAAALEEAVSALHEGGVKRLFAGHCTGDAALGALRRNFSGETIPTGSGLWIET